MNLGKKSKSVIAIYAIVLVIYIIGFLIIPFNKIAASWISFAFTIIAIAVSLFVLNHAFNSKKRLVSKIYGYPIFRVGAVYALAQLAIGIIICAIGAFVAVPYLVALLLSIIMFGAAAIGVIITDNTRDLLDQVDETVKVDTEVITNFQIDIAGIVDCCEDSNLKSELEKLNDAFRFSDPVSNATTKEAEDKINVLLNELKATVARNDIFESTALVKKITNALSERNRLCKASKVH